MLLTTRGLEIGHAKGRPLLSDLDISVRQAEILALTGRSGSGKSTLLYTLGTLMRPLAGEVVIEGEPVTTWPEARQAAFRARRLGFVFQDALLDAGRSVIDSVTEASLYAGVSRGSVHQRALELLSKLEVTDLDRRRPGEVSGGQAQRIGVARALLMSPRLVLADEPTGNLDPQSGAVVLNVLREYADQSGSGVVIATHDPVVVGLCDRVVNLP